MIFYSCNKFKSLADYLAYQSRTSLIGVPWGHVSLVYRENKTSRPLLIDFTQHKPHARIVDLENHLQKYYEKNQAIFGVRQIKYSINNEMVKRYYFKYRDKSFSDWYKIFLNRFILFIRGIGEKQQLFHCGEFIAQILIDLGVIDNEPAWVYYPDRLVNLSNNLYGPMIPFNIKN